MSLTREQLATALRELAFKSLVARLEAGDPRFDALATRAEQDAARIAS